MKSIVNFRKSGLLAASVALILTACQKEPSIKDPVTNPPAGATKLKKVSDNESMLEFTYGTDGILKAVNTNDDLAAGGALTTFNISYTADKKISELKATGGYRFVAHYTADQLTSADMYDENNDLALVTRYEYQNGELKTATGSVGNTDVLKFSFAYNSAGNVQRTAVSSFDPTTNQLQLMGHTDFEYDGKTNPMHANKVLLYLLFQNTSKNNVTKEKEYDNQDVLTETTDYTYQYNSQSFPQSATIKTTPTGQPATTKTLLYSYQ